MSIPQAAVVQAFLAGTTAKTQRIETDGQSIMAYHTCLATRAEDGTILVYLRQGRSGSIMRAIVRREIMASGQPYRFVHTTEFRVTRELLIAKDLADQAARAEIDALIKRG